jgi:AmpE protein
MSLIVVFLSLLIERIWRPVAHWRDYRWLDTYGEWVAGVVPRAQVNGWAGLAALVIPVLVFVALLQLLFDDALFGLLELAFGVVVLLYTLGPRDLDSDVDEFVEAYEIGDGSRARAAGRSLLGDEPSEEPELMLHEVTCAVCYQAHVRVFAVVFWYVVLGPFGAALYRLAQQLDEARIASGEEREALAASARLFHGVLAWPSSRLLAATYTLTGSFEEARAGWRRGSLEAVDLPDSDRRVLMDTGAGAVRLDETALEAGDASILRRVRGLVVRSLVVWVVVIALLTLFGML